jgi:hypothetical protein
MIKNTAILNNPTTYASISMLSIGFANIMADASAKLSVIG